MALATTPLLFFAHLPPSPHHLDLAWRMALNEVVGLQQPYPVDRMTMRGPVFPTRERAIAGEAGRDGQL